MPIKITASLEEIGQVVEILQENISTNAIIFLTGDLAAGKTTLTQAIAKSKGCDTSVTSPTFSLQQVYDKQLYHYDLYRIDNEEFFALGLHEELEKEGWHIIEWADESLKSFLVNAGYNTASIVITPTNMGRDYSIEV